MATTRRSRVHTSEAEPSEEEEVEEEESEDDETEDEETQESAAEPPPTADAPPAPSAPNIADVFACLGAYLTAHYAESLTDQAAVDDAARLLADGHVIPAWRALSRMVEQVLNVPPGG